MSEKRKITVFSTKGQRRKVIETDVKTWGELMPLVENEGYDLDALSATENVTRHDLNHIDGVLPEGPFTLFLRPTKTKSGLEVKGLSFNELRELVKEHKEEEGFVDHINSSGKNYTRLKKDKLAKLLKSWEPKTSKDAELEDVDFEEVAPSQDLQEETKTENEKAVMEIRKLAEKVLENCETEEVEESVQNILDELAALEILVGEEEFVKQDLIRLKKEAEELMKGFTK